MKFVEPIKAGTFLKRYKRFFADIRDGDDTITAHVPNTGSMKGLLTSEVPCRFTVNDDPKRKLKFTLQMLKTPTSWVGVNTHLANNLVWEAWEHNWLPHWEKFDGGQREVKLHAKSRIDMVLWQEQEVANKETRITSDLFDQGKFHFVEVKNVTLAEGHRALFPDAVTSRGQKHLSELMHLMEQGHTAELMLMVQRTDCDVFSPADDIDPEYGQLLRQAHKKGLTVSAYSVNIAADSVTLAADKPLAINL